MSFHYFEPLLKARYFLGLTCGSASFGISSHVWRSTPVLIGLIAQVTNARYPLALPRPPTVVNMSRVITEFSFGGHFPNFPEMAQSLDNSFDDSASLLLLESVRLADVPAEFVTYQYYLRVVTTTNVSPRSQPLQTNQYSVTHYEPQLKLHAGVPGFFFKFDI